MFGVVRQTVPLCPTSQCRLSTSRRPPRTANLRAALGVCRSKKFLHQGVVRCGAVTEDLTSESYEEAQAGGSGPGAPGGRGGSSGGDGWNHDDGSDGGHYFGGWIVFFLAMSPFAIDGARKLSFGRDGVRILDLPAEPGMYKPIFAAAVMGSMTLSAPPPPPPQKMSNKGGISFLGVVAILALSAGGYYIYTRRKRGSFEGAPMSDDELQLEGFPPHNVGTRDLDPSLFSALGRLHTPDAPAEPASSPAPEVNSAPDVSQELSVKPPVENPILESSNAKDAFFGENHGQSIPESPPPPLCEDPPSPPAVPAALSDTRQLSPDEVVKDMSSNQYDMLKQDTRSGDIYADDLPSKDKFFGVRTTVNERPDVVPCATEESPVEENALQSDLEMKDKFLGVGTPDVQISTKPTVEIGSMAVPKSLSPCASPERFAQQSPQEVVKIHDSTPRSELLIRDTRSGNILEDDLQAKDLFFRPATKSDEVESTSILDEMSDPIMKDIAQELEDNSDQEPAVQVLLKPVGNGVELTIGGVASQTSGATLYDRKTAPKSDGAAASPESEQMNGVDSVIPTTTPQDPVIADSTSASSNLPEVEVRESPVESNVDHGSKTDDDIKPAPAVSVAEPDDVSDAHGEDTAPPQKTVTPVEVPKEVPAPTPEKSIVDEAALQKTLADLGLSPAPLKFPKRLEEERKSDIAAAQAPTTPTKESALEILAKSPVLSNIERVKSKKPSVEEKLASSDSKGSDDSSGSHEGRRRSATAEKGNGGSGATTPKKRKKKRGKKSKGPKTNMH